MKARYSELERAFYEAARKVSAPLLSLTKFHPNPENIPLLLKKHPPRVLRIGNRMVPHHYLVVIGTHGIEGWALAQAMINLIEYYGANPPTDICIHFFWGLSGDGMAFGRRTTSGPGSEWIDVNRACGNPLDPSELPQNPAYTANLHVLDQAWPDGTSVDAAFEKIEADVLEMMKRLAGGSDDMRQQMMALLQMVQPGTHEHNCLFYGGKTGSCAPWEMFKGYLESKALEEAMIATIIDGHAGLGSSLVTHITPKMAFQGHIVEGLVLPGDRDFVIDPAGGNDVTANVDRNLIEATMAVLKAQGTTTYGFAPEYGPLREWPPHRILAVMILEHAARKRFVYQDPTMVQVGQMLEDCFAPWDPDCPIRTKWNADVTDHFYRTVRHACDHPPSLT